MRSQIYSVRTKTGQQFRLNDAASIGDERCMVRFIEHVELVSEDQEGDNYVHGFFDVYGIPPDGSELLKNDTGLRKRIHYKDVAEIDEIIPLIDLKVRHDAFVETTTDEYRERPTSLPREKLEKAKEEIEKAIKALDDQDEREDNPPAAKPTGEPTEHGNAEAGSDPGQSK